MDNKFYSDDSPEYRIASFVKDWYSCWGSVDQVHDDDFDFDHWNDMVQDVEGKHFVPGCLSGTRNSFSSIPDFDPSTEEIISVQASQGYAVIVSKIAKQAMDEYHVYDVIQQGDGSWLIKKIITLLDPPEELVIAPTEVDKILALASESASLQLLDDKLELDENLLFKKGRKILSSDIDDETPEISFIGNFHTPSGILGIMDFGDSIYEFEPLEHRVKPGHYKVEAVMADQRVGGIRILFKDDKKAVKWYSAKTPKGNGIYGVDAGNLAIFDVSSLTQLNNLKKERLFTQWSTSEGNPQLLNIHAHNDGIITSSGYGDGAYPAFWGVDENDNIVSLYIDFLVLVKERKDGILITI